MELALEFGTAAWWSALLAIILIDLVLAGDNAIVIGLAARNVPKEKQKVVIFWGTAGAIIIRTIMTLIAAWLLSIPGLLAIGGVLLVWIAYKLMIGEKDDHNSINPATKVMAAIQTIVIADTVMGVDNVIAVAGAAHGDFVLVIIGLLVSIPIVVWGSTLFIHLTDKYPVIIDIGAAVLAWTAAKMLVGERLWDVWFDEHKILKYGIEIVLVVGVLVIGRYVRNRNRAAAAAIEAEKAQ